jgi:integrase
MNCPLAASSFLLFGQIYAGGQGEMEVYPIMDLEKIAEMKKVLEGRRERGRDILLLVMGINTALRIGDLLALSVGHVLDNEGKIAQALELREQKTGKTKRFPINESLKEALLDYLAERQGCDHSEPLFLSQKGGTLGRVQAWRIISEAGESVGLSNIGAHSLRKTFGYHVYKKNGDIGLVQKLLNHSASRITLRYIGIDRERMDRAYLELNL